jgi:hypothetical protein
MVCWRALLAGAGAKLCFVPVMFSASGGMFSASGGTSEL